MVGAVVAARGEQPDEHLLAAEQTLVRDALATLQWPLALVVIAAMQHGVAGPALRDRAPSLVDAGRAAVGFIAAHLPADLAGRFLARTDLGPLLDAGSADVAGTFDVPR